MKLGDVITAFGPAGTLVTGIVADLAPLKTRSGWTVGLVDSTLRREDPLGSFMLRPEDEGVTWIYGEDQKGKNALLVGEALADKTVKMAPRLTPRAKKPFLVRKRTV